MGASSQTIVELIASLPEEERFILTLHYLKGKSSADIALLLTVPEKSVIAVIESGKSRISRELGF